jgi:hypothetical protein
MTTFKNPLIASFDLVTQSSLLVCVSLDPPRLPMDSVDMDNRQSGLFAHFPSQRAFS